MKLGKLSLMLPLGWIGFVVFLLLLQAPGYYFRIRSWSFGGDLIKYYVTASVFIFPILLLVSFSMAFIALKENKRLAFTSIFLDLLYGILSLVYLSVLYGH